MKLATILCLIMSLSISLKAQHDSTYVISEVVSVPGADKNELYNRAQIFIANAFVNPNHVVLYIDTSHNKISIQAVKTYSKTAAFKAYGTVKFNFDVELKEGRYMYTFYKFIHESPSHLDRYFSIGSFNHAFSCYRKISKRKKKYIQSFIAKTMADFNLTTVPALKSYMNKKYVTEGW